MRAVLVQLDSAVAQIPVREIPVRELVPGADQFLRVSGGVRAPRSVL
jgi:hypothetical protein